MSYINNPSIKTKSVKSIFKNPYILCHKIQKITVMKQFRLLFESGLLLSRLNHSKRHYCRNEPKHTIKMDYSVYKRPHSLINSPPILIMHGLGVSRTHWRRPARMIASRGSRVVITVDARNHGDSEHTSQHSPALMAVDTAHFMRVNKLDRIVALGHCMGGRALMTLALTQPKLVERAIFVDITPGTLPIEAGKSSELFEVMREVIKEIPKGVSMQGARAIVLSEIKNLVKNHWDLVLILHNLRRLPSGAFIWCINTQALLDGWCEMMECYETTLQGLSPYPGEALLIAASNDFYVTTENIATMQKYFPNLRVEYLNAQHKIHLDQPTQLVKLVVDFTKR